MKNIFYILLVFLLWTSNSLATQNNNSKDQALAFCWQNKDGLWWCDGPLQILWSPQLKLNRALKKVGCRYYDRTRPWAGNKRVGHIFYCKKSLSDYDRDIRGRYGL